MSVQIANPKVIAKIERLSQATHLGKTAAVEMALDRMLAQLGQNDVPDRWGNIDAILGQLHRLVARADAFEAVEFDDQGLPR